MITKDNFLEYFKDLKPATFDEELKLLHFFAMESTESGTNWNAYEEPEVKPLIDDYFKKLNAFFAKGSGRNKEEIEKQWEKAKVKMPARVFDSKSKQEIERRPARGPHKRKLTLTDAKGEDAEIEFTERIPDEIRFIRRYLSLNNKKKTKEDLRRFINALQRAMIEKRIRKASPFAKQIDYIQDKLVKTFNSMNRVVQIEIAERTVLEFKELIASEKVFPSISLIKRYVSLNGKYGVKEKAKTLLDAMTNAFEKGRISKKDKYIKLFDFMHANLSKYIKNKGQKILSIAETELNGLNGVLSSDDQAVEGQEDNFEGVGTTNDENVEDNDTQPLEAQPGVMSSMDFNKIQFETIGFTGKYRDLIGDPSPGFSAMVFGRPKMGKSHLCVDFAGYLARNHGKVLYVAKEEGLDYTLQEKLKANDVAHPNLDISETIPEDLSMYRFVFLDSVNSLGLSTEDLVTLKNHNPNTSFIQIFQTTKAGSHRGDNESQHNVDVIIEVPEKGMAVQNGRFNQGGEMRIFNDEDLKN